MVICCRRHVAGIAAAAADKDRICRAVILKVTELECHRAIIWHAGHAEFAGAATSRDVGGKAVPFLCYGGQAPAKNCRGFTVPLVALQRNRNFWGRRSPFRKNSQSPGTGNTSIWILLPPQHGLLSAQHASLFSFMNDAQDENEALLAVDSSFTPNWVPRVLVVSRLLRHWQWQLPLVAVHASLVCFAWRCLPLAAQAAGLTDSSWCSVRASLFWIVGGCGSICDFVAMLAYLRSAEGDLPSAWDQSRLSLEAAHHSLAKVPENIVAASIFQVLPVVLWVRHGLAKFAVAAILMVTIFAFLHFGINALTFEFWGVFIQKSQSEFADTLARGELTFSEAVRAFGRVNAQRKAVAKAVKTCVIGFFSFFCLQQAIMLYDFELRSWGGWIFGANFVSNVLVVVFIFEPYIQVSRKSFAPKLRRV